MNCIHDLPRVGMPHSYASPFCGLYERGEIARATPRAIATSPMAVRITTISSTKYIYCKELFFSGKFG